MDRAGNRGIGIDVDRVWSERVDDLSGRCARQIDRRVRGVDRGPLHVHGATGFHTGDIDRAADHHRGAFRTASMGDHITAVHALLGDQLAGTQNIAAAGDEIDSSADGGRTCRAGQARVVDGQSIDVSAIGHQFHLHGLDRAPVVHARSPYRSCRGMHGDVRVAGRQSHVVTRSQTRSPVRSDEHPEVRHTLTEQVEIPSVGDNLSIVLDRGGRRPGEAEVTARHELLVRDIERRRDK